MKDATLQFGPCNATQWKNDGQPKAPIWDEVDNKQLHRRV